MFYRHALSVISEQCSGGMFSSWNRNLWLILLCKYPERHLVSISPIFYRQLFRMEVFCAAFKCIQFGFVVFGKRILVQKLLIKCWWNWNLVVKVLTHFWIMLIFSIPDETKLTSLSVLNAKKTLFNRKQPSLSNFQLPPSKCLSPFYPVNFRTNENTFSSYVPHSCFSLWCLHIQQKDF